MKKKIISLTQRIIHSNWVANLIMESNFLSLWPLCLLLAVKLWSKIRNAHHLSLDIKFYWNTTTAHCWCDPGACFLARRAKMSGGNRHSTVHQAQHLTGESFANTSLLTFGLKETERAAGLGTSLWGRGRSRADSDRDQQEGRKRGRYARTGSEDWGSSTCGSAQTWM